MSSVEDKNKDRLESGTIAIDPNMAKIQMSVIKMLDLNTCLTTN